MADGREAERGAQGMIEAGQKVHLGHRNKIMKSALSGIAGKIEKQSWKEFF